MTLLLKFHISDTNDDRVGSIAFPCPNRLFTLSLHLFLEGNFAIIYSVVADLLLKSSQH
jgi:hypothetical protein